MPGTTPATRKARLDRVVADAKARGEKIPAGMKLIQFRDPTSAERAGIDAHARDLAPLARKRLAEKRRQRAAA